MNGVKYTILIPVYNGEKIIERTINEILKVLDEYVSELNSFEILIVENGSMDNTIKIVQNLTSNSDITRVLHLPKPDLGIAVKTGIKEANGESIIYLPADLSYGSRFILDSIKFLKDYEIVFGSKYHPESSVKRSFLRQILSKGFFLIVKTLYRFSVKDTQGVKSFRKDLIVQYVDNFPDGFLWDIGFVYLVKFKNYNWIEIPCEIEDYDEDSTIKKLKHTLKIFFELFIYRFKLRKIKKSLV